MWIALSASSTPFGVTPVPSLSSVSLRSCTVSLLTQDSQGGGALRDMVMIQAQVVELPVTGTHLPSAASVAPMWVTWRTACPAGVAPSDGPWWASGEWVFDPWHVDNTPSVMRAHVRFVCSSGWTDFATGNVVCQKVSCATVAGGETAMVETFDL